MSTQEEKSKNHGSHKHASHNHGSHKRRRRMRHLVSLILSFLLALCITSFLVLVGCKVGIFNTSVLLSQLNKTNYYENISNAIRENVGDIIRPTGLPDSVLEGVIDDDRVYLDVKATIEASLENKEYHADMTYLEQTFTNNIDAYIKKEHKLSNASTQAGLKKLLNEIKAEYIRLLDFPFIKYFVKYQAMYDKIFLPAAGGLLVVIIVLCFALIKMQRWAHRGIRYISYATLASVIMTGILPLIIQLSGAYKRINISPKYLYNLLVGVISSDMTVFLYLSLGCILAFAGEMAAIKILKDRAVEH